RDGQSGRYLHAGRSGCGDGAGAEPGGVGQGTTRAVAGLGPIGIRIADERLPPLPLREGDGGGGNPLGQSWLAPSPQPPPARGGGVRFPPPALSLCLRLTRRPAAPTPLPAARAHRTAHVRRRRPR